MPVVNGLQETFAGRIEFIVLDFDDKSLNQIRSQFNITAQAQYVLVNSEDVIVRRWFGVLDEAAVTAELEQLLLS